MARGVGGQAVLDGVMMRGSGRWAVAVRRPDGTIGVHAEALPVSDSPIRRVPFLRGLLALGTALPLSLRSFKASAAMRADGRTRSASRRAATAVGLLVAAVVSSVVPAMIAERLPVVAGNGALRPVVELLLSLGMLLGYLAVVGRLWQLRRLFEYHGAEHKVVSAHEAGVALTPESVAGFSTRHARCGTSLLVWIAVSSAVVDVVLGGAGLPTLVTFPLVAALATEVQLRAAEHVAVPWVRRLLAPGLALQSITTREPSPAQMEVAIAALHAVLGRSVTVVREELVAA